MAAVYDVFVVKKNDATETSVQDMIKQHSERADDVIFIRQCVKHGRGNTFIVCLNKTFGYKLVNDENLDFAISKYSVNKETLEYGQTWGFHIKCNKELETYIEDTFKMFEDKGFIHKGTYQIKKPTSAEGVRKDYVIITFKKKNDRYPKQFIRKLKGLMDYKTVKEQNIKINWIRYNMDLRNKANGNDGKSGMVDKNENAKTE